MFPPTPAIGAGISPLEDEIVAAAIDGPALARMLAGGAA
jgi:hypothetical protein